MKREQINKYQKIYAFFGIFLLTLSLTALSPTVDIEPQTKRAKRLSQRQKIAQLRTQYKSWLNLVDYIITEKERKAFIDLSNDRDRDLFITLFWRMRDPTEGTDDNEYREEHQRRFNYANKYFKFSGIVNGWRSDMGRIYIILGEPDSKSRYDDNVVVPCELWSYSGRENPNLPLAFWMLFFRRGGAGPMRVYNPVSDGPYELVRKRKNQITTDAFDNLTQVETIAEYHPILARAALSLIPDDMPDNFTPSLRSQMMLGQVYDTPKRKINAQYATNFLHYKGIVDVDYSMSHIGSNHDIDVFRDPISNLNFVHLSILPDTLSIDFSQERDRYFFNWKLYVSLKQKEKILFSYSKNFEFYLTEEQLQQQFGNGVVISDLFPIADGSYTLSVMIQNEVKKDFTYFETKVSSKSGAGKVPTFYGPIVSYAFNRIARTSFLPMRFGDLEITANPKREFGTQDPIFVLIGIDRGDYSRNINGTLEVSDMFDAKKYSKSYPFSVPDGDTTYYHVLPLEQMPSGNYRVRFRATGQNGVVLGSSEDSEFVVNINQRAARPAQAFKIRSVQNRFIFFHQLAIQYQQLNQTSRAEQFAERAFAINPNYPRLVKDYADILIQLKKYNRVLEIAEQLRTDAKSQFEYFNIRGKALYYLGRYNDALNILLQANKLYDSDIGVLNVLGFTYLKLGEKAEARRVFEASLRLNDKQTQIKEALNTIK